MGPEGGDAKGEMNEMCWKSYGCQSALQAAAAEQKMQIHFQSVETFLQNYAPLALLLPCALQRYRYHHGCSSVADLAGDLASLP